MSGSILMLTTISINLETLFVESHFLFNFRSMNSWKNHTLKKLGFFAQYGNKESKIRKSIISNGLKLKWSNKQKKSWKPIFCSLWKNMEVGWKKKYCDKIGSCLKTKEYQRLWKPSFIVTSFLVAKTNGKSGGRQTFKSGMKTHNKTKFTK